MDKLRSTLKQFVRDWSEEVRFAARSAALLLIIIGITGQGRTGGVLWPHERRAAAPFR